MASHSATKRALGPMKQVMVQAPFLPDAIALEPGRLDGEVAAPPSKSISHRLMILGAVSGEPVTIQNVLWCQDTEVTYQALRAMGYLLEREGEVVFCRGWRSPGRKSISIQLGESGSSARFLLAVATRTPGHFLLDGSARLRHRPLQPLVEGLQHLGAEIDARQGLLPLTVRGGRLTGGRVLLDASVSSQFVTALLLIAPFLPEGLEVHWQGPVASYPYVELTLALLTRAGINWEVIGNGIRIQGNQSLKHHQFSVEGDFSNASYFLAGALIGGGEILCRGLTPNSAQGDRAIVCYLEEMGGRLTWEGDLLRATCGAALRGIEANLQRCPDLVPTLAVAALFANGRSRFTGIGHLALKESNRILSVAENARRLGARVQADAESLTIDPGPLKGAILPAYRDHRIAMAFALAGLRVPAVIVREAGAVAKSYPGYWQDFFRCFRGHRG